MFQFFSSIVQYCKAQKLRSCLDCRRLLHAYNSYSRLIILLVHSFISTWLYWVKRNCRLSLHSIRCSTKVGHSSKNLFKFLFIVRPSLSTISIILSTQGLKKINPLRWLQQYVSLCISTNFIAVSPTRSQEKRRKRFTQVSSGFYRISFFCLAQPLSFFRVLLPPTSSSSCTHHPTTTAGRRSLAPMSVERSNFVISPATSVNPRQTFPDALCPRVSLASRSTPRRRRHRRRGIAS